METPDSRTAKSRSFISKFPFFTRGVPTTEFEKIVYFSVGSDDASDEQDHLDSPKSDGRGCIIACSRILDTVSQIGLALLPSFVTSYLIPEDSELKKQAIHPTAYLDGIRGFASLFVFFWHFIYQYHERHNHGFGCKVTGGNNYLVQLPIIRLFYAGPAAVHTFFVISGFALSCKSLKLLQNRSYEASYRSLASSVFRRSFRLYIPPLTSTLIIVLLLRAGVYEAVRPVAANHSIVPHPEGIPPILPTFWSQIWNWIQESARMCSIFGGSGTNPFDGHLWTIPIEYRDSMVVFFTILGLSKLRPRLLLLATASLLYYVLYIDDWPLVDFYAGMLIAELSSTKAIPPSTIVEPSSNTVNAPTLKSRFKTATWWILFVLGLLISSIPPDNYTSTPFYSLLAQIFDRQNFWYSLGSVLIIYPASNSPSIQRLFTTPFAQYLGKISYALYLCHATLVNTLGTTLVNSVGNWTGRGTLWEAELAFGLAAGVLVPCVIWYADVFWRLVDVNAVRIARWVEEKVSVGDDEA